MNVMNATTNLFIILKLFVNYNSFNF